MLSRGAIAALILVAGQPASAGPHDGPDQLVKLAGESDAAFASRVLKVPLDEVHTLAAPWNGVPTIFVDYVTGRKTESPERPLIALQRGQRGTYRKLQVTVGETEGGEPDIEAIGFANADHDPAKELIVILAWNEVHGPGSCYPIYEVRIFDDPKPGADAVRKLKISDHFGQGCVEPPKAFRFTSVALVKRELRRLGY